MEVVNLVSCVSLVPLVRELPHIPISSSESSFCLSSVSQHISHPQHSPHSPPPMAQVSMSEVSSSASTEWVEPMVGSSNSVNLDAQHMTSSGNVYDGMAGGVFLLAGRIRRSCCSLCVGLFASCRLTSLHPCLFLLFPEGLIIRYFFWTTPWNLWFQLIDEYCPYFC